MLLGDKMRVKQRSHEKKRGFPRGLIEKAALPAALAVALACGSEKNSDDNGGAAGAVETGGSASSGGRQSGGTGGQGSTGGVAGSQNTGGQQQASICGVYDDNREYDFALGEGRRPDCENYVITFIGIGEGDGIFTLLNADAPSNPQYIRLGVGEKVTQRILNIGDTVLELCSVTSEPCTFNGSAEPTGDANCRAVLASSRPLGTEFVGCD